MGTRFSLYYAYRYTTATSDVVLHALDFILESWSQSCDTDSRSCSRNRHLEIKRTVWTIPVAGPSSNHGRVNLCKDVCPFLAPGAFLAVMDSRHEQREVFQQYLKPPAAHVSYRASQCQLTVQRSESAVSPPRKY